MEKSKPVGIWIRVSTEDQVKGESPEHHEKRARYYAESKGWQVKEVYLLEAVSGKAIIHLPEAQNMMDHIRTRHITGLIFSKLARLARNTRELLEFSEFFRIHNADLISLQESIDTSSPAGRLFYTMIAAMAQWEREEIADRVAASVPIRAKLGKPLGGQASLGYRWQDKKLVVDPQEAPIRRLIYELFAEHRRKKTVARILTERGYRTRSGANFSDTTIERLLEDSTAKGLHRLNYTKSLGDKRNWVLKPEEDWVFIEVPSVVSPELWDQCNSILEEQRKKKGPPTKKVAHLFTGYAFCECGSKMYVPSNSPKYICYSCRNKIGIGDLEGIFQHQLKAFFFSPEDIAGYMDKADQTIKEKEELLQSLAEERTKIKKEMDKVYRLYVEDQITPEGFGRTHKPLEARLKQIDDSIPEHRGEIDFLKIQYLSSDQILSQARDLYSNWPALTPDEKRQIVESITDKLIIGSEDVTINLCYLPSASSKAPPFFQGSPAPEKLAERQRNFTDWWP
ncbi:MAG TPA: recombinase family protein [Candidatus Deferrimicrobiaceae bacterium]|jgi:site-specific DNA recombinase